MIHRSPPTPRPRSEITHTDTVLFLHIQVDSVPVQSVYSAHDSAYSV